MGKAKAAAVPVDELVRGALSKLAEAGESKLAGKGDPAAVFDGKSAPVKKALEILQVPSNPLIAVRKKGATEVARLTPAGFLEALPGLPAVRQGELAEQFAAGMPADERARFLMDAAGRLTGESSALLLKVVETLEAEARAAAAAAARRRTAEAELYRRMLELQQAEANRLERDLSDARSAVERLRGLVGGSLPSPMSDVDKRHENATDGPATLPPLPRPETPEDFDFRRQAARRLVSSWLEAVRMGKDEGRRFLETAIGNMTAIRQIGEEGEEVPFDGAQHESDRGVGTGEPVRVVRPGWVLDDENGEYLLAPAVVG